LTEFERMQKTCLKPYEQSQDLNILEELTAITLKQAE